MIFNVIKYLILISTLQSQVIAATFVTIPGIVASAPSPTPPTSTSSLSTSMSSLSTVVVGNINQIPGRNAYQLTAIPATQATVPTIATAATGGQYYLLDNEAAATAADNTIVGSRPLIIQPYNIFDSVILCPIGYILANNHCHKQVKYATKLYAYI